MAATRRRVRSLFVSDIHIGFRYSRAGQLLSFLKQYQPEQLYLVGDIIDGWRLRRRWHWQPLYHQLIAEVLKWASEGVAVRYTPGNHDEFLRDYCRDFGFVEVADEFVHQAADGRCYLVLHGDRFDGIEQRARWLSRLGCWAYDLITRSNCAWNRVRASLGLDASDFGARLKRKSKQAMQFVSDFEESLASHARQQHCDGVICGHIHTPVLRSESQFLYANTGDWVEHGTAIVETCDGTLELHQVGHSDPIALSNSDPTSAQSSNRSGHVPKTDQERQQAWQSLSMDWPEKEEGTPSGREPLRMS